MDGHYLVHLEHALRELVKVTTTNYKDACIHQANLNSLEIVREVRRSLYGIKCHRLSFSIVYVEFA